jgi:phage baseplate assembly protein W
MTSRAISLPFSFDANGAVTYSNDQKKIIQDRIVLVVMTLLSERVMRPSFGTKTRAAAFENLDAAMALITQEVSSGFAKWLNYLTLISVSGSVDQQDGYLNVIISYKYGVSTTAETLVVKTAILNRSGDVITEVTSG